MKLGEYLYSKLVLLCFLAMAGILFAGVAAFWGASFALIQAMLSLYVFLVLAWLAINYTLTRHKIHQLQQLANNLPQTYLLGEVVLHPTDPLEQQYYQIMLAISRSAVGCAQQAIQQKEEYCQYVESWIHEIKTPLTACNLILANGGNPQKLKVQLRRADNLTESILYYARLRSQAGDTQIKPIYAKDPVEDAVKSQMELLIAAKIQVHITGNFCIHTDPAALCFMVKQLLINAAKYCPGCTLTIALQNNTIAIGDNGPGIPPHQLPLVTRRGYSSGGSTGMGLYLVDQMCHKLGIKLKISSSQNTSTCFYLVFST